MKPSNSSSRILFTALLLVVVLVLLQTEHVSSFVPASVRPTSILATASITSPRIFPTTQCFMAAKNKKSNKKNDKKKGRPSSSGFGGAASEPCPCGGTTTPAIDSSDSDDAPSYMNCCGKLHKRVLQEYPKATPEQVVRARYSAYAKREIDFIVASTHPQNKNFQADIAHWRKQIDLNCYDNFELTQCEIVDMSEVGPKDTTATVTFVANMIQRDSREKTAFQETSTFEKIGGVWMYLEGKIEDPPGREEATVDMEEEEADGDVVDVESKAEDAVPVAVTEADVST